MSAVIPPTRRASDSEIARLLRAQRLRMAAFVVSGVLIVAVGGWFVWRYNQEAVVHDTAPSWSLDGRRIVFSAFENGAVDVYVMNANGTDRRNLTASSAEDGAPVFSPDGTRIAFESNRDGNSEIYVMDSEGRSPKRLTLTEARDRSPSWSPDGRHIIFASDRERAPDFDIFQMDPVRMTIARLTSSGANAAPSYSPDGSVIAFERGGAIVLFDVTLQQTRPLTQTTLRDSDPAWSPDGESIAFVSRRNGRAELFVMGKDGANQRRLVTMASGQVAMPRWSPNGENIAFVHLAGDATDPRDVNRASAIYLLEVGSDRLVRLSR